jgi:hypothetical protein
MCNLTNYIVAGWSSSVARRAHNPKVAGSNPVPAIPFLTWDRIILYESRMDSYFDCSEIIKVILLTQKTLVR